MSSTTILIALVIIAAVFYGTLRLSVFMTKRAVCKVVKIFRMNNAVHPVTAVALHEVGLSDRPNFFAFGLRDYKPYVIQMLVKAGVLLKTPDNRIYLSEGEEAELERKGQVRCAH